MLPKFVIPTCATLLVSISFSVSASAETGRLPAGVTPLAYDITVAPDATKLAFTGEETITIEVAVPTPVLTLNAADLAIGSAVLDGAVKATVKIDESSQTASFTFAQPVAKGRHTLKLSYSGKINRSAAGLFAVIVSLNEFVVSLFISTRLTEILPVAMFSYVVNYTDPTIAALSTLFIVGTFVVVWLADRFLDLGGVFLHHR